MARLDRLGGPAKEIAQIGAAIGREFSHALLAAVMQKPEAELRSPLIVWLPPVCCSGRASRHRPAICSSTHLYKTRPMARCCASRDARYMPASLKLSKATSLILPRTSLSFGASLHRGWTDRKSRWTVGQGWTTVAGPLGAG